MLANRVRMGVSRGGGFPISEIPIGSKIIDDKHTWEHKTGNNYTGNGEVKPVVWLLVAKNHVGYPANSITLIADEIIGRYYFASNNTTIWGTSNIRSWLNSVFYNNLSNNMKKDILGTQVDYKNSSNNMVYSDDNIFIPSSNELNLAFGEDGVNYGYFTNNLSRKLLFNGAPVYYGTRTPVNSSVIRIISNTGDTGGVNPNSSASGVRPVINISAKANVSEEPESDGYYRFV